MVYNNSAIVLQYAGLALFPRFDSRRRTQRVMGAVVPGRSHCSLSMQARARLWAVTAQDNANGFG